MSHNDGKLRKPKYGCPKCSNTELMTVKVEKLGCGFIPGKAKSEKGNYGMPEGVEIFDFIPIEPFELFEFYRFYCKECTTFFQDPTPITTSVQK